MLSLLPTRCPACDAVAMDGQTACLRCREPLRPAGSGAAATGDTARLYHAAAALLLLSRGGLEYAAAGITLVTPWHNIATIRRAPHDDMLCLYATPATVSVALGSGRDWYSDRTRVVPLRQFGFPANRSLRADLVAFAPQLRRAVRDAQR